MTPERWQQLKTVLEEVESAPAQERAAILERLCSGDPDLLREVSPFLAESDSGTFIRGVIGEQAASLSQSAARQERFGRYQLVRQIGIGGMGAVYEAVRVDDFHKKVALKIIKQGLDSDYARTRFVQERQLLASLEHPYIARLLDGGESNDGSPYLVLEFVDGEPITQYCERLDRTARLQLFLKVCEAVEHAHGNLVVHRDLKPANILVTASGDPKLLDFGIAKLLDPAASQTQTGFAALTPEYASPEQVRGEPITTASDIYSLGVILYQLLTGRKPYTLGTVTALEMDRVICTQPPAPPDLGDELDHILLMALRKEPERRYSGVQRFADDIQRYMQHRPVSARPDTVGYRAQKFVRRNWWQIAAVVAMFVTLGAGLGFSLVAQRRANHRFNQVRQLANRFLFDFHDEIANTPGTVKARGMIVSTALEYLRSLSGDAAGDPGLQWEMAVAYGKVAAAQGSAITPSLGQPREALSSYEKAFALARPLADRNLLTVPQRVTFVNMLATAELNYQGLKENDRALSLGREAVARSVGLPGDIQRVALHQWATILGQTGDLLGSVNIRERTLPLVREKLRNEPTLENQRALLSTLVILGYFNMRLTRFDQAVAFETEAITRVRQLLVEHPNDLLLRRKLFEALNYLALTEGGGDRPSQENYTAAIGHFEEDLAVLNAISAADVHDKGSRADAVLTHLQLALIMPPAAAAAHASAAAELADAASTTNTEVRALTRIFGADAHRELRQFAAAELLLQEADRILQLHGADTDGDLTLSWARLDAARGNLESASRRFDRAIALYEDTFRKLPTPSEAWEVSYGLRIAADALPATAAARWRRILEVWIDQNRRFPGLPYMARRIAEAQSHLQ